MGWRLLVVGELGRGVETFGGRGDSSRLSLTEQPSGGTLEQPTSGTLHPIPAHVQTLNIFVLTKEIYGEFVLEILILSHFNATHQRLPNWLKCVLPSGS